MDLYVFATQLGPFISWIRMHLKSMLVSVYSVNLYKFLTHGGVRPLFKTCKLLTQGGVRPLLGLLIVNLWWGPSSFGTCELLTHGGVRSLCELVNY